MIKYLMGLTLAISAASTVAFAVKVSNLYNAELPVPSQTYDIREKAVRDGFAQVLMKLTGDPNIIENPVIRESLGRAGRFVKEYNYSSPEMSAYEYQLNVHFEKNDVNQLIKNAGANFWGENRPLILVWMVVNGDKESEIIGNEHPIGMIETMSQQSRKIGLPLIFPMMDVTDLSQVTSEDVTSMNIDTLKVAGKRYGADGFLIGEVETTPTNIQSRWLLVVGGNEWTWKIDNKSTDELVVNVITQITRNLTKNNVAKTQVAPSF